jgi:hypothetical protein
VGPERAVLTERCLPPSNITLVQTVRVCRVALFVLALALAALVAADMFYTARFFHRVPETLYSVAAGLGFFQLPLAWYAFTRQEARPWPVKLGAE